MRALVRVFVLVHEFLPAPMKNTISNQLNKHLLIMPGNSSWNGCDPDRLWLWGVEAWAPLWRL